MKTPKVRIKEILSVDIDKERLIYTVLFHCTVPDYYQKYDNLRTNCGDNYSRLFIIDIENDKLKIQVCEGELLLDIDYKYASNYIPMSYENQDRLELLPIEEQRFFEDLTKCFIKAFGKEELMLILNE